MSSRIRLYSSTTTLRKTVLHNVQPMVIPRRVWNMATSAVCNLQLLSTAVECSWCRLWKHHSLGCGDVADISNNGGITAPETDCNMTCSGDSSHLCGGFYRIQLYLWKGTLNNWQTPSNIGRYEVRTKIPFLIHAQARYNFISVPCSRPRTSSACYGRYKRQGVLPREIHDVRV